MRKTKMKRIAAADVAEIEKLADETFDRIYGNPKSGSGLIISARRKNKAKKFNPKGMKQRALTNAAKHVSLARLALKSAGKRARP